MSDHGPRGAGPSPTGHTRSRIAWVTNVGAPYRHPVWASLAAKAELRVGLLADNEPNRQWTGDLPTGVPRLKTRAVAVHRGEVHLYGLLRPALGGGLNAVILPGWEMPASWQLLLEAKLRRIRTVAFYESSVGTHRFDAGPVAWFRWFFFRHVDAVITVGEASTSAVLGFGVPRHRIFRTDNTVDVSLLHAASASGQVVDRRDRFLYVGQLIHRKNVDGLLEAFARLPTSARLVVAGEGPAAEGLRSLSQRLGIADRVDFRDYVQYERVPSLLAEASTLVLASRSEVYGLVVIEALAAGLHVVVSDNCGVFSDVRGLAGVFPAQSSTESLAAAMAESAAAWDGPLEQPAIMARTPEAMAAEILLACGAG